MAADLTPERRDILRKAWEQLFYHIFEDTTTITNWQTTVPGLMNSTAPECSLAMLYELFDIAAYEDMDQTMLRFLRARKFNVTDALTMLNRALLWRAEVNVREIMQGGEAQLSPQLVEAGMYLIFGHDLERRPIVLFNIGNFIPPKTQADTQAFTRYLIYNMESARFFIGSTGIMALMDLSNFARKHIDLDFAKQFADMFQSYYPEILGRAIIVGSGLKMTLFETAWAVAKYFLDPDVRRKVSFHKAKDVPQFIAPPWIPQHLGGQFNEAEVKKKAPPPSATTQQQKDPGHEVVAPDLKQRQLAEMQTFRTAPWGSPERESSKARLRDLWLEMADARPPNLHERLGILKHGRVDWSSVASS